MKDWVQKQLERIHAEEGQKGGPGSGHFGHAGRPGKRGGSLPGSVAVSIRTGRTAEQRQRAASPHKESDLQRAAREWEEAQDAALAKVESRGGTLITEEEFNADPGKAVEFARSLRYKLGGRKVRYTGVDTRVWRTFTPLNHGDVYTVPKVGLGTDSPGTIGLTVKLPNGENVALNMTDLELVAGKG